MLTNTERQAIVEEVNAGTYGIDEALDDIAAAQKGEEVRKALYAEALVLNREGHAGSTDMIARQQIANLQTSVNGQISTLRTEVGDDIDDLETALNSGLATQNGKIAAQDATIANVVANYNVEYGSTELWASTGETGAFAAGTTITLSEDVSHFDYIDIYSFLGNNNILDTLPVDAKLQSNEGYALRWVNLSDPGSGTYEAYVRIVETKIKIIGTTLTIIHQVTYSNGASVSISGAEITQSNRSTYVGELGIMKVVGRKITANTEVTDIRIGSDGTTYNSAGAAVRGQVEKINSKLALPYIEVDTPKYIWTQGDLSLSTGGASENPESNRVRIQAYLMADSLRCVLCFVPAGYQLGYRKYKRDNSRTFIESGSFATGLFIIDNSGNGGYNGYRFVLRKADDSNLTPSDVPSTLKIIPVYRYPWEKSAVGESIQTFTTKRNNPTLVQNFINIAESYYTHRNDKTGDDYDMEYGVTGCLTTTNYTRQIDCSTFVGLVLRGWGYEDTQYYTKESDTTYPANPDVPWSVNPFDYSNVRDLIDSETGLPNAEESEVRTASQLAQWMISQGQRVPMDDRFANLEVGDIIFYANKTGVNPAQPNRFGLISHVAIVCAKRATTADDDWSSALYPYTHTLIEVTSQTPCVQKRYVETGWDDRTTGTNTQSGLLDIAYVCRPDLGALAAIVSSDYDDLSEVSF